MQRLDQFVHFWSNNAHTRQIWVSLYTPQIGEASPERLLPADRERWLVGAAALAAYYSAARNAATVEVDVIVEGGLRGRAAVPSGASTGEREALELEWLEALEVLGE